jgi:hypothetical protein
MYLSSRPCVGCGYCCQKAKCALGAHIFGSGSGACPGLIRKDGRYWCGPVLWLCWNDETREYMLYTVLAAGAGCCSPMFNTQRDAALRRQA